MKSAALLLRVARVLVWLFGWFGASRSVVLELMNECVTKTSCLNILIRVASYSCEVCCDGMDAPRPALVLDNNSNNRLFSVLVICIAYWFRLDHPWQHVLNMCEKSVDILNCRFKYGS
jgi:hypothetical protein